MNHDLQYFVGKVCSAFIVPSSRQLEKEGDYLKHIASYHVGMVESINEKGVLMNQLGSNQKSFWFFPNVIGLAEEKVLDPKKDAELIDKLKESKSNQPQPPKNDSQFLDVAGLATFARQHQKQPVPATAQVSGNSSES